MYFVQAWLTSVTNRQTDGQVDG